MRTPRQKLIQFAGFSLGTSLHKEISRYNVSVALEEIAQEYKGKIQAYFNGISDCAFERLVSETLNKASRVRESHLALNRMLNNVSKEIE